MSESLYRIMYRRIGIVDYEWTQHYGGKGTSTYGTIGAARGAITHFKKQDTSRNRRPPTHEYKVQKAPVGDWEDVPQ